MTTKQNAAMEQALEALSLALSDVDWRKDSPTQPLIHKAYNQLRAAHAETAEPVAWQRRMRLRETVCTFPQQSVWTDWFPCTEQAAQEFASSKDEQWEYEVRALYAAPQPPAPAVVLTAMQQAGNAAAHHHAWSKRYTEPQPPAAAVERAKPDCSECADWRQRALDNQQWIRDVAKGREEIRRMAIEAHEAKKSKEDNC